MLHPFYYLIMTIMVLFSFYEFSQNKKGSKAFFIMMVIFLILLSGLRVLQGADYPPYLELYKISNKYVKWRNVFNADVESSYVILSKILGQLRMPFFVLLTVYATISISLKSSTIYKFAPYPFLGFLLYFMPYYFFDDSGQIRQGAAMGFCLFSYRYIANKNVLKFLITIFLGYFFHKTALLFLPAYWIANRNISIKTWAFFVAISIALWPLRIYEVLGDLLITFEDSSFVQGFKAHEKGAELELGITEFVKIIFLIILFSVDKRVLAKNPDYMKCRNIYFVYFCLFYIFHANAIFSVRLPNSYGYYLILVYPMIVQAMRSQILYMYIIIYIYMLSWRFWGNARSLNFDDVSNVLTVPYNFPYNTPREFIKE